MLGGVQKVLFLRILLSYVDGYKECSPGIAKTYRLLFLRAVTESVLRFCKHVSFCFTVSDFSGVLVTVLNFFVCY